VATVLNFIALYLKIRTVATGESPKRRKQNEKNFLQKDGTFDRT